MYREREMEEKMELTSMKTVFNTLPETVVIFAVIILSLKDSKTSQSFTIVSVLFLHVKLTTNVFSLIEVTLSCEINKNKSKYFTPPYSYIP